MSRNMSPTIFVSIRLKQIDDGEIVSFEMAQIPNVLFATGWSKHQLIMSRCKTDPVSII